jgi:hypothetical protein
MNYIICQHQDDNSPTGMTRKLLELNGPQWASQFNLDIQIPRRMSSGPIPDYVSEGSRILELTQKEWNQRKRF